MDDRSIYLVRPSLGQPLLFSQLPSSLTVTIAGTTNDAPGTDELTTLLTEKVVKFNTVIRIGEGDVIVDLPLEPTTIGPLRVYRPFSDDYGSQKMPISGDDHRYVAGYRWDYQVDLTLPEIFREHLSQYRGGPYLLDLSWKGTLNRHAIYVDPRLAQGRATVIHITDLHVARRNDDIPKIVARLYDARSCRELEQRYINFNDNLRSALKYANENSARSPTILVATGDLVDYYHDGYADGTFIWRKGQALRSRSNFRLLHDILSGHDGKTEAAKCPVFTILGNHDYLLHEPPLQLRVKLWKIFELAERNTYKAFGLTKEQGISYDYFNMVDRSVVGRVSARPLLMNPQGGSIPDPHDPRNWEARLDDDHGDWLLKAEATHLWPYLTNINYDTDFIVSLGKNVLVCLNSGPDRYPGKKRLALAATPAGGLAHNWEKDFVEDGPHLRGITQEQLHLTEQYISTSQYGVVMLFSHAPLLNFHKDAMSGREVLYEDAHLAAPAPPNEVTRWFVDNHSCGKLTYLNKLVDNGMEGFDTVEDWDQAAQRLADEGYPQTGTRYFKRGDRGKVLNFGCADGESETLLNRLADRASESRPFVLVLGGHTHKVHEFRVAVAPSESDASAPSLQIFTDDYTKRLSERAGDAEPWLRSQSPLLLTSGALKSGDPILRKLEILGGAVIGMKRVALERTRINLPKPGRRTVVLREVNSGRFVRATGDGGDLLADREDAHAVMTGDNPKERFGLLHLGQRVALLAANGRFVGLENSRLIAESNVRGLQETFNMLSLFGDEAIALRVGNNHYVSARDGGGGDVRADRNHVQTWETLRLIHVDSTRIALQTHNNHFLGLEDSRIVASARTTSAATYFEMVDLGELVAISSFDETWFRAAGGGGGSIAADRAHVKSHESFHLTNNRIVSHKGHTMCADRTGHLKAVSDFGGNTSYTPIEVITALKG